MSLCQTILKYDKSSSLFLTNILSTILNNENYDKRDIFATSLAIKNYECNIIMNSNIKKKDNKLLYNKFIAQTIIYDKTNIIYELCSYDYENNMLEKSTHLLKFNHHKINSYDGRITEIINKITK